MGMSVKLRGYTAAEFWQPSRGLTNINTLT